MARVLNNNDFLKIETSLLSLTPKYRAIIALLLYTGIRVGELVLTKSSDLIIQNATIKELHVRASSTKSMAGRYIPIPKKAAPHIQDYLETVLMIWNRTDSDYYLFPGTGDRDYMSVHGVEQLVAKVCMTHLKMKVNPHVFRHTYATRLLRNSNTREVQLLLGHKKLSSTEVYTHPTNSDLKKSVDKTFS